MKRLIRLDLARQVAVAPKKQGAITATGDTNLYYSLLLEFWYQGSTCYKSLGDMAPKCWFQFKSTGNHVVISEAYESNLTDGKIIWINFSRMRKFSVSAYDLSFTMISELYIISTLLTQVDWLSLFWRSFRGLGLVQVSTTRSNRFGRLVKGISHLWVRQFCVQEPQALQIRYHALKLAGRSAVSQALQIFGVQLLCEE